jgi:uncharacterized metal-binding protein YceD (DUF177 family)
MSRPRFGKNSGNKGNEESPVKIHLKQIPADGLHLEGEEECLIPELAADGIRCSGPLRYNLDIGLSGDDLWANGSLTQPVELTCVACLEKFIHDIEVPAFAVHTELHGPEVIDLTPMIREDILLSLPANPHCDADGKRTCKAPPKIPSPPVEKQTEAKREHDWGPLDKLKVEKK